MDFGIKGKRAVVTGGTTGLGFAVCKSLAAEGVNLLLFSRTREKLDSAQEHLRDQYGVEVDICSGDMSRKCDVQLLKQLTREKGGADILVLNTGRPPMPMREFLGETDDDRWDQAYQHQLNGALIVLREITPLLIDKGWGRIVAITSATVKQPMAKHALSTVFRAGLQAALKHLSNEIASQGVTVNSVAPASILTESLATHNNLDARAQSIPIKRLGTQEELAAAVVFLASRQAGFITGQTLHVDGGMTASLV